MVTNRRKKDGSLIALKRRPLCTSGRLYYFYLYLSSFPQVLFENGVEAVKLLQRNKRFGQMSR